MRIISGSRRGLRLKGPKSNLTRPTEDRLKESLFNILFTIPSDSLVLDLFAGSGSVGLEFLSRGAKKVYFIEKNRGTYRVLLDNIEHCKFKEESISLNLDYKKALYRLSKEGISFDYIFLDPPYDKNYAEEAVEIIIEENLLNPDGLIIIEHENELKNIDNETLKNVDRRDYGGKYISFYSRR